MPLFPSEDKSGRVEPDFVVESNTIRKNDEQSSSVSSGNKTSDVTSGPFVIPDIRAPLWKSVGHVGKNSGWKSSVPDAAMIREELVAL